MTRAISKALAAAFAAVEQTEHELIGKLVRHPECPDEHFFVERFEGEYRTKDGEIYERVLVRGVERLAHETFPARADQLEPISIN